MVVLTNGPLFYWVSWLLWGIITFFWKKDRKRTMLACLILLSIISSNVYVKFGDATILMSFPVLMTGVIIIYAKTIDQFYDVIATFTIMIGYTSLIIWKEITPMWLFVPEVLIVPIFSSLLTFILVRELYKRLIICLLAVSIGELLYSFILSSYNVDTIIGDLSFFDYLATTLLFIGLFHTIQIIHDYIYTLLGRYKERNEFQNES